MDTVIKIIGIVIVFIAIIYLLKPQIIKRMIEFFKHGRRVYLAGLMRFALAVVFLVGATDCQRPGVIIAFGILFIISGLLIFTLKLEKIKAMFDWWQNQSLLLLRVVAVIVLVIGAVIIYSA